MPATTPLFTVIVVNYNAGEYLERCLRALLKQSLAAFEVIIVDNDSRDNSLSLIAVNIYRIRASA